MSRVCVLVGGCAQNASCAHPHAYSGRHEKSRSMLLLRLVSPVQAQELHPLAPIVPSRFFRFMRVKHLSLKRSS